MSRVRRSIQQLQAEYDLGNRAELENLMRAWRGIQQLPPYHPDSFFGIAAYHGQPFRGPGVTDPSWWGGFCNHGNVLFPTWHRAYLWRLEEALRSMPGCGAVTLPFWDELADPETPIPAVLTAATFPLDGVAVPNPLRSYALQEALVHNVRGQDSRYTKPAGYATVRYPQSGLVGTAADRAYTERHNAAYADADTNTALLNGNVRAWMQGTVEIPDDGSGARIPDTFSVRRRWELCLEAPNYTVFSNTSSQTQWVKDFGRGDAHYVVSLESPHNAVHLAVGGFYQRAVYNASPILGANGDMGANETAGFDPIFYLHHCFVDYAFALWQQWHGRTARGSLDVIPYYPGCVVPDGDGIPNLPPGSRLAMDTPLYPFRHADQTYVTSLDVTDIAAMGYAYGPGSLDPRLRSPRGDMPDIQRRIVGFKRVHNVNRARYPGSFVIRTFVGRAGADAPRVEIGREPVLSRRDVSGCANCQNKLDVESLVPVYEGMIEAIVGGGEFVRDAEYSVEIHTSDSFNRLAEHEEERPKIEDLWA